MDRKTYQRKTITGGLLVVCLWAGWHFYGRPSASADGLLALALQRQASGDTAEAESLARQALDRNPSLAQAAFLAASCAADQGEFGRAVDYASQIRTTNSELLLDARLLVARLLADKLHRLSAAERAWRAVLQVSAAHGEANYRLSLLLAQVGRPHEAAEHALRVVRAGDPANVLILLARPGGSNATREQLELSRQADPEDSAPVVGLALLASLGGQRDEAMRLLEQALRIDADNVAAHVAMGQVLLDAEQRERLAEWQRDLPEAALKSPRAWIVKAKLAEQNSDPKAAIRCYWESLRIAPESRLASSRLARLLAEAGRLPDSARFVEWIRRVDVLTEAEDRILLAGRIDDVESVLNLVSRYRSVGRFWEAYGWSLIAAQSHPDHKDVRRLASELSLELRGISLAQTAESFNPALAVDLSAFPLPDTGRFVKSGPTGGSTVANALSFRDEGTDVGLEFHYCNGNTGKSSQRMFELTGGGIGVVDFDLDGWPDVSLSQGHPWDWAVDSEGSTDSAGSSTNDDYRDRLFWNHGGRRLEDVSISAGFGGRGFGQGVAVGDYDSDGFPDVFVANIGRNRLWRNNGDGTFSDVTDEFGLAGEDWSTSCVIADLTGDGHPDIYEVNYLTAPDVFNRVCSNADGSPRQCSPVRFDGADDRLWVSDGGGKFIDRTSKVLSVRPNGKGLGVAVWDAEGRGRLDLMVANDTTPNFLFRVDSAAEDQTRLIESGFGAGVAVNENGTAEGCMGIALGDIDEDGRLDALMTNYLGESSTLYVNVANGFFEDRTRERGLDAVSLGLVGFGAQFYDADLDGTLELFIANGHVADLSEEGSPWQMPPHLYRRKSGRFLLVDPQTSGPYFQKNWLGRAVARCDWNRDGRDDFFVGHMVAPSTLLTNTTQTEARFLSIRLFGVKSPRDAIGTTVEATFDGRTIVRQLTAGDGYQTSNERRLLFGTGSSASVEKLVVRWPSGLEQTFDETTTNQELWLVEGEGLVPNGPLTVR
jgi:tetratricopeptide (TPR) repeat protein